VRQKTDSLASRPEPAHLVLEEPSSESNTGVSQRSDADHNTGFGEGQRHFFGTPLDDHFMRLNPHSVARVKRMIERLENSITFHPQFRVTASRCRCVIHTLESLVRSRITFKLIRFLGAVCNCICFLELRANAEFSNVHAQAP
jgi:hypothetical protein